MIIQLNELQKMQDMTILKYKTTTTQRQDLSYIQHMLHERVICIESTSCD